MAAIPWTTRVDLAGNCASFVGILCRGRFRHRLRDDGPWQEKGRASLSRVVAGLPAAPPLHTHMQPLITSPVGVHKVLEVTMGQQQEPAQQVGLGLSST